MRIPSWMFLVGLVAFIGATALCSVFSYTFARQFVIDAEAQGVDTGFLDFRPQQPTARSIPTRTAATPSRTPQPGETFTPELTVTDGPTPTFDPLGDIQPWNDPRRVTILLMGIDQRGSEYDRENAHFTDTMILVQIDPVGKRMGVLSIPRDLWVRIPGYDYGRINTANYLGDINQLPDGGPGLAMETIRRNIGVSVDYYARINFDVFLTIVDTVAPDGVEIEVTELIDDPDYPDAGFGTIPVRFEPGVEVMNAERLLQYARTRATDDSDFGRARRQQQVLRALQAEVLSAGGLLNAITQIPTLYSELAGSYETNAPLDEILRLARLVAEIPSEAITFGQIGPAQVEFAVTGDGTQQILIPRQEGIARVVQSTFDPQPELSQGDLRLRAEQEAASIVVFNNAGVPGLAQQTSTWLNSQNVDVAGLGNIDPAAGAPTTIRDYGNKPYTAQYLAQLLGLSEDRIIAGDRSDGLTTADIMIVAGPDIQTLLGAP
ncbi:MAG: LCP family protein [bacterium]|nr:LCP family protein [bacterium]